jgi:hypothetical protein
VAFLKVPIKITKDLGAARADGEDAALTLLDFFKAIDCIPYNLLVHKLRVSLDFHYRQQIDRAFPPGRRLMVPDLRLVSKYLVYLKARFYPLSYSPCLLTTYLPIFARFQIPFLCR